MAIQQLTGQVTEESISPFDSIRQVDEHRNEYWLARDLQGLLGYALWQRFVPAIEQAKENVELTVGNAPDHFLSLMIKSRGRDGEDFKLTRLACYHIALACNGRGKPMVAAAKQYFVEQTYKAETTPPVDELKKLELQNESLRLQIQLEIINQQKRPDVQASFSPAHPDRLPIEQPTPVDIPPVSLRTQINNLAQRPIAVLRNKLLGQGFDPHKAATDSASTIWRYINKEFKDRYHIDLKARTQKGKKTRLQVAEELDKLNELHSLVNALYGQQD